MVTGYIEGWPMGGIKTLAWRHRNGEGGGHRTRRGQPDIVRPVSLSYFGPWHPEARMGIAIGSSEDLRKRVVWSPGISKRVVWSSRQRKEGRLVIGGGVRRSRES